MDLNEIENCFRLEFGELHQKFDLGSRSLGDALSSVDLRYVKPGVYVFWQNGEIIKVGRHLQNVHKRALEHVRDDTGGKMKNLNKETQLLFFTLTNQDDLHWAFALEVFLERKLKPVIVSKRMG
jgi:hypothetical protein